MDHINLKKLIGTFLLAFGIAVAWALIWQNAAGTSETAALFVLPFGTRLLFCCFICLGFWLIFAVTDIRKQRYETRTGGRDYIKDRVTYKRSYHDLMQYYDAGEIDSVPIDDSELSDGPWRNVEGVILGKSKSGKIWNIQTGRDGTNTFIFGRPGSGKTAGPIILSALQFNGSVFAIDVKGDVGAATEGQRKIKRFDFMHPETSCHFNPLAGIEDLSIDDRLTFVDNLCATIIPQDMGSGGSDDAYFLPTACDYFCGIVLYLLDQNINISFPEIIAQILRGGNAITWVEKVRRSDCIEAKDRLAAKFGENERNLSGAYSRVTNACAPFARKSLSFLMGNDVGYDYISPQDLEDGYDVYLCVDQKDLTSRSTTVPMSLIVQTFLNGFLDREKNPRAGRTQDGTLRPVLFILDEFAQLTSISPFILLTAFTTLRSRNVSLLCAVQSMQGIMRVFRSESAKTEAIECCSTFAFLSIQDVQTRQWASDLIGKKPVLHRTTSSSSSSSGPLMSNYSGGGSSSESREYIIPPARWGSLKDKRTGRDDIVIYSDGKYLIGEKIYFFLP